MAHKLAELPWRSIEHWIGALPCDRLMAVRLHGLACHSSAWVAPALARCGKHGLKQPRRVSCLYRVFVIGSWPLASMSVPSSSVGPSSGSVSSSPLPIVAAVGSSPLPVISDPCSGHACSNVLSEYGSFRDYLSSCIKTHEPGRPSLSTDQVKELQYWSLAIDAMLADGLVPDQSVALEVAVRRFILVLHHDHPDTAEGSDIARRFEHSLGIFDARYKFSAAYLLPPGFVQALLRPHHHAQNVDDKEHDGDVELADES